MKGRRPQRHERPGLPAVNLLSPAAFERLAVRKLRHRFVAAGCLVVLLVVGGWAGQYLRVTQAEQLLAVEQAETDRLAVEAETLAPIRAFVTGVAAQEQTVQSTMAREIYFSRVLAGLQSVTPSGANLTSVAITLAAGADALSLDPAAAPLESTCPGPDPFNTRTVVGCIALSGTAASRAEVGELVTSLGRDGLFVEPFISTTTTADAAEVSFSGSVGLSSKVYSERYADAPATEEEVAP